MAAPQGKYINAADLISRLTPATYIAIFDDKNNNDVDNVENQAVQDVIDAAEGEVDSYLVTEKQLPLPALTGGKIDRLVRFAALDFATSLCWRRHPEYVRQFGENTRADQLWTLAADRMKRVREAIQELPDIVVEAGQKPANVGGIYFDDGPRTIVPSMDGTDNDGDF